MLKPSDLRLILLIFRGFWSHLEAILAPLGPPGGPLGSQYFPGPSQDPPRNLQESFLQPPGADLGPNFEPLGQRAGLTKNYLRIPELCLQILKVN